MAYSSEFQVIVLISPYSQGALRKKEIKTGETKARLPAPRRLESPGRAVELWHHLCPA